MKQKILLAILCCYNLNAKAQNGNQSGIITNLSVNSRKAEKEASGAMLSIVYTLPGFENNPKPIQGQKSEYAIFVQVRNGSKLINAAQGWGAFTDGNGAFLLRYEMNATEMREQENNLNIKLFVPYAALSLDEGTYNNIAFDVSIIGTDKKGNQHEQTVVKNDVKIVMPPTYLFTIDIDSVEATVLDKKGRGWDYSFRRSSAPDMKTNIMVGNQIAWSMTINDTYLFNVGNKSKNIKLRVSQNDAVYLAFLDQDPVFDQTIGILKISTKSLNPSQQFRHTSPFQNVKSCSIRYSISK